MVDEKTDDDQLTDEQADEGRVETHAVDTEPGPAEGSRTGLADEPPAGTETDELGEPSPISSMEGVNRRVIGTLTLHYSTRDVRVPMDGDSAMRLLTMFRQRRDGGHGDEISTQSFAGNGWLVLDLSEPLAMSWWPQMPPTPRTALDPIVWPDATNPAGPTGTAGFLDV